MRLPTIVVRGEILSSWLTVSGYTQAKLARELAVSRGRISQLLGSQQEPSAHLIAKLMMLTRLPFDRLFRLVYEARPAIRNGRRARPRHQTTGLASADSIQEPTAARVT